MRSKRWAEVAALLALSGCGAQKPSLVAHETSVIGVDGSPPPPMAPTAETAPPVCAGPGALPASPAKMVCCYTSPGTLRQIIRTKNDDYQRCYEEALSRRATLEGRMVIDFTVDRDGMVRHACEEPSTTLPETIDDPPLAACLTQAFTHIQFPELGDVCPTMRIHYPMTFTRDSTDR